MLYYDPIKNVDGQCIPVSRAAVGIYLALSSVQTAQKKVLVPANICYAAIFPILYLGMKPVFCDVSPESGNVTYDTVSRAIEDEMVAMIIPHMYGNPVKDLMSIAALCKNKGILLIEDCASAMGATQPDYTLGCVGDFTVYSTGYSKTLDLGFGGLLISHCFALEEYEKMERMLPCVTEEAEENLRFFSSLYRLIRNQGGRSTIPQMIYKGLPNCVKLGLIHSIDENKKESLIHGLCALPQTIIERRKALTDYQKQLTDIHEKNKYCFSEGAVPWRFNMLIDDQEKKKNIIRRCISEELPVSDWYPVVTHMFQEYSSFPGAIWHEKHILNFPLLIMPEKRKRICKIIKSCYVENEVE